MNFFILTFLVSVFLSPLSQAKKLYNINKVTENGYCSYDQTRNTSVDKIVFIHQLELPANEYNGTKMYEAELTFKEAISRISYSCRAKPRPRAAGKAVGGRAFYRWVKVGGQYMSRSSRAMKIFVSLRISRRPQQSYPNLVTINLEYDEATGDIEFKTHRGFSASGYFDVISYTD